MPRSFSLLVVGLFVLVLLPVPGAQAVSASTTIALASETELGYACGEAVAQDASWLGCPVNVRTTVATPSGFDVELGLSWIGDPPNNVNWSFSHPVIHCPPQANAACGETGLGLHAELDTYAPAVAGYNLYATRLCGGVACSPTDRSFSVESVDILRSAVVQIRCDLGFTWPVFTRNDCHARVTDGPGDGVRSRPEGSVHWNIFYNTGEAPCTLQPVPDTDYSAECSWFYEAVNSGSDLYVHAGYQGDARHGHETNRAQTVQFRRQTEIAPNCPAWVYAGEMASCDVQVVDIAEGTTDVGIYGNLTITQATNAGRGTGHLCAIFRSDPASCDLAFTPTGNASLRIEFAESGYAHDDSDIDFTVERRARPTLTTLTCPPGIVPVNGSTPCTVIVEDMTVHEAPLGTVDLSFGGSCTLAQVATYTRSSCNATYVPPLSAVNTSVTLGATYRGTVYHAGGTDTYVVNVTKRSTTTDVVCEPTAFVPLFGPAPTPACVAFVNDTSSGAPIPPTGNVTWTSVPPESFQDALDQGACAVSQGRCGINASLPIGDQMLTGTYAGDAYHATGPGGGDIVHVHAETALRYDGAVAVLRNASFAPRFTLASAAPLCSLDRAPDFTGVTLRLDRDPTTGAAGAYTLAGPLGTDATGALGANLSTAGWRPGVYALSAAYAGDPYCDPSNATVRVLVGDPAESATGTVRLGDQSTNVAFRVAKASKGVTYSGSIDVTNGTRWALSGNLTSLARTSDGTTLTCAADGVGTLSKGTLDASGRLRWTSVGTVRFGTLFDDAGPNAKKPGDRWTAQIGYLPRPGDPPLPGGPDLVGLSFGNIVCK